MIDLNLHVLVLAAGASQRLGHPKQLVRIRGRPVLHTVVHSAEALVGPAVTVVVGANAKEVTQLLCATSASVVLNREWEEGLASSIRSGISALSAGCEAVLLLLGDQVAVTGDDLKRLASAWQGQDSVIATAAYAGTVGVPAIFPRWCFSELTQLRGDQGAKLLLQRYAQRLVHVPMPNAGVDLDTPEDLVKLVGQSVDGGKES